MGATDDSIVDTRLKNKTYAPAITHNFGRHFLSAGFQNPHVFGRGFPYGDGNHATNFRVAVDEGVAATVSHFRIKSRFELSFLSFVFSPPI